MGQEIAPDIETYPEGFPAVTVAGSAVNMLLFVPGDPIPKDRPRFKIIAPAGKRPYAQVYTDKKTMDWEDWVGQEVIRQLSVMSVNRIGEPEIALPLDKRLVIDLRFNLRKPDYLSRKIQYPVKSRSDTDNLVKSVLDGLQQARIIRNDCLVTDLSARKRYADLDHPIGVEIDLSAFAA